MNGDGRRMVQIPSGDMVWVSSEKDNSHERPDTITGVRQQAPDPVEAAVADSEHRPNYTCPWCGMEAPNEELFRDHITARHGEAIGQSAEGARAEDLDEAAMARAMRNRTAADASQ